MGFSWLDAWYIAKLGQEELTAIDICFPIITFTSSVIYGGLGTGVKCCCSSIPAKNKNKTAWGIRYAIILAVAISLFITLTIVFWKTILNHQLPNQPIITDMAYTYCLWYYVPYSLMGIGAVLASSMRGTGNAVRPMIYSLIAGMIINGILTPLFSYESTNQWYSPFFLDMGMKGAALATVFAYVTMAIFLLKDYFCENQGLKRHTKAIASEQAQKIHKRILSASFIAALVPACTNFVIGFSQSMLSKRGQFVLDAIFIVQKI